MTFNKLSKMKYSSLALQCLLFVIVLFGRITFTKQDQCRRLKFASPFENKALVGHVIKNITLSVGMRSSCRGRCTLDRNCVSINIGPPINEQVVCQLSDSDHLRHPEDLVTQEGFMYQGSENSCSSNPCFHNATCLNGFTDKKYICVCQFGYTGEKCDKAVSCKGLFDQKKDLKPVPEAIHQGRRRLRVQPPLIVPTIARLATRGGFIGSSVRS